jgi:hypothetical protein
MSDARLPANCTARSQCIKRDYSLAWIVTGVQPCAREKRDRVLRQAFAERMTRHIAGVVPAATLVKGNKAPYAAKHSTIATWCQFAILAPSDGPLIAVRHTIRAGYVTRLSRIGRAGRCGDSETTDWREGCLTYRVTLFHPGFLPFLTEFLCTTGLESGNSLRLPAAPGPVPRPMRAVASLACSPPTGFFLFGSVILGGFTRPGPTTYNRPWRLLP